MDKNNFGEKAKKKVGGTRKSKDRVEAKKDKKEISVNLELCPATAQVSTTIGSPIDLMDLINTSINRSTNHLHFTNYENNISNNESNISSSSSINKAAVTIMTANGANLVNNADQIITSKLPYSSTTMTTSSSSPSPSPALTNLPKQQQQMDALLSSSSPSSSPSSSSPDLISKSNGNIGIIGTLNGSETSLSSQSTVPIAPSTTATTTAALLGTNIINATETVTNLAEKAERPSLSYKDLIIEAIESSPEKRLKLNEIYQVCSFLNLFLYNYLVLF